MQTLIKEALLGVVLPGVGSLATLLVLARPWRREGRVPALAGSLAIGMGYLASHLVLNGIPYPVINAHDWLPWLVLSALILAIFGSRSTMPSWLSLALRLSLAVGTTVLLLMPLSAGDFAGVRGKLLMGLLALSVFGFLSALAYLAVRVDAVSMSASLTLLAAGSAMVLAVSGSAYLGRQGGVLAAAIAPSVLLSLWRPGFAVGRATVLVFGTILSGLWLNGMFYSDVPPVSMLLLVLSLLPVLITWLLTPRWRRWPAAAARVASTLPPLAAALVLAVRASPPAYY